MHKTIQKVTEDIETLQFNTAISAMMELLNAAYKEPAIERRSLEAFLLLISPFAPHVSEELWSRLGHSETLAYESWPTYDPELVREEHITISVQVNGRLRGTLSVPLSAEKEAILQQARALQSVGRHLLGKTIQREIFVPGRIVNFVAN